MYELEVWQEGRSVLVLVEEWRGTRGIEDVEGGAVGELHLAEGGLLWHYLVDVGR